LYSTIVFGLVRLLVLGFLLWFVTVQCF